MTTTPSTASQAPAVSIHCQEFHELAMDYRGAQVIGITAEAYAKLVEYIDAKRAQEREEAIGALAIAFEKMLCAAVGRDWSTSGISASSLVEELRSRAEKAEARATAAEAKLKAIRQGVGGIERYEHWDAWGASGTSKAADGDYVKRDEVLALFQPQPQADESGLTG